MIDLWANFLYNEKFDPRNLEEEDVIELIDLCEALAKIEGPRVRPHALKLRRSAFSKHLDSCKQCEALLEKLSSLGNDIPEIEKEALDILRTEDHLDPEF